VRSRSFADPTTNAQEDEAVRGPQWLRRLTGEMSKLEDDGSYWWGKPFSQYALRSNRVNYELARQLYRNTHDDYKLGAWAARPVVNSVAGFMGAAKFMHPDEAMQHELDVLNARVGALLKINRNMGRDGDVFARLSPRQDRFRGPGDLADERIDVLSVPPHWIEPITNPLTGELMEVIITYPVYRRERSYGNTVQTLPSYNIIERITAEERELTVEGQAPEGTQNLLNGLMEEDRSNPWGFIPIVHFKNESEDDRLYGLSDLEGIEPFMRAYHDVFLHALEGSKLHSRPKVQIKVKDINTFIKRNFTDEEIRTKRFRFQNKELFMLEDGGQGDEISFITAQHGTEGAQALLEFLFMCIVDVSETPEFAFGTAVRSSKASVSEQMPVFARRITRKRGEAEDPFGEFGSMYLAVKAQMGMPQPETYRVSVEWDEVNPDDQKEFSEAFYRIVQGVTEAVDAGLMSHQAGVEFIGEFCPHMLLRAKKTSNVASPWARGSSSSLTVAPTTLDRQPSKRTRMTT
jgi:hypothetical protein